MGQDPSTPVDESVPPTTLQSLTVEGVADLLKSGRAKRVVVMAGAGISTSAGIPDFRSPDTGLYANLARLDLPFAEAVFDISFFRRNPEPFYTLARELYPGKYRPTVTHAFFRLLHERGILLKVFTQNIDCLEREAGLPGDAIVEAHGSFATQRCIECATAYPDDEMRRHVARGEVPKCKGCKGLVKPDIVFFGEQLPPRFHANRELPARADLCIVLGTSLTVQPFASLPSLCPEGTPRLLINKERVGGLGGRPDDVLLLGDCDEGVRKLARACGWADELEAIWARTAAPAGEVEKSADAAKAEPKSREEGLDDEVDKLTKEIEQTLDLSKRHADKVRQEHTRAKDVDDDAAKSDKPTTDGPNALHYESQADGGGEADGGGGIGHVFSHLKKPSL